MVLQAMTLYRVARALRNRGVPLLPAVVRKLNYYLHSSYIPEQAELGDGTQLGYGGIGVVIHRAAKVGKHCLISQQVTLGGRSGLVGAPIIGDYVRIGAGAKILGNIRIGDFAVIGANAVVLKDVPAGAVVAGVPAKVIRQDPDPLTSYQREMGLLPPRPKLTPVPAPQASAR
ncbi:serine acetyltransferase [Myxococcaceae bacterium JPH2]|nr:serine acetyltransferase [Myxococcaceae bacterium JPH2]